MIRKMRGLTQRILAKDVGISPFYLCHLESERHEPSLKVLMAICEILNTELKIVLK